MFNRRALCAPIFSRKIFRNYTAYRILFSVLFHAAKGDKIIRFYTPLSIIFLRNLRFGIVPLPIFHRNWPLFAISLPAPLLRVPFTLMGSFPLFYVISALSAFSAVKNLCLFVSAFGETSLAGGFIRG
jgi:hypothetical protein